MMLELRRHVVCGVVKIVSCKKKKEKEKEKVSLLSWSIKVVRVEPLDPTTDCFHLLKRGM
jgi:hypothetical protein